MSWKPPGAIVSLKCWKVLIILGCWNAVLVKKIIYLKVFVDKLSVQDSLTIVVYISSPRRKWFSSKCNSHGTKCFVTSQSLLLAKRITCLFNSTILYRKMKFCNLLLFITGMTRSALRSCIFIKHCLKYKVVIFAKFLKHICEKIDFNKFRCLQHATLVATNTFTSNFQGFCLIWTNSYLTNASRWLLLVKHK